MHFLRVFLVITLLVVPITGVTAQHAPGHHGHGPYAGMERREIKSLSNEDIAELRRGGGWGTALPAELNGFPGPAHLIELKDKLGLSGEQVHAIEAMHAQMKADAIAAGERLIAAEKALDAAFVAGGLTKEKLRTLITAAEAARADVRFVHLSRHLETPPLLKPEQIDQYNRLRGYGSDPCVSVPAGHDPVMWRRHNNCK
ncbi:MAG TPA: hypothetical protein PK970_08170 [Hyphomicrobiaceae bacterium]|nr:hypothetical protein [Hyphomicrobiaceae bacterium]